MMKEVYKVVRPVQINNQVLYTSKDSSNGLHDDDLCALYNFRFHHKHFPRSIWNQFQRKEHILFYQKGKTTFPMKYTALFCYEKFEDIFPSWNKAVIVKGTGELWDSDIGFIDAWNSLTLSLDVTLAWLERRVIKTFAIPKGTVFLKSFTLTEIVATCEQDEMKVLR